MTIDIINYTDEQLAALSAEKVLEIREAQLKKNKLLKDLNDRINEEKCNLINRGIYPSDIYDKIVVSLTEECDRKIDELRESLVFFLHYVADDAPIVYPDAPYTVDYSLTTEERLFIVKAYYEETYQDEYERYAAFKKDELAKVYLGELYTPLHDYFYRAG